MGIESTNRRKSTDLGSRRAILNNYNGVHISKFHNETHYFIHSLKKEEKVKFRYNIMSTKVHLKKSYTIGYLIDV